MVNTMKIELTPEQIEKIKEDEWLRIVGENGIEYYFEFKHNRVDYCEVDLGSDDEGNRKNTVCFGRDDIEKIISKDPYYGFGNSPQCPNCGTHLIYQFNYCPECGQAIKWGK